MLVLVLNVSPYCPVALYWRFSKSVFATELSAICTLELVSMHRGAMSISKCTADEQTGV